MADCLIALGANLGDRAATLDAALTMIADDPQTRIVARSGLRETAAIGGPAGQQPFLNAAARIATSRDCRSVWALLAEVERRLGRVRDVRWGPRTVDLDLLLYDDVAVETLELVVPHPRMAFRRFVLAPAAEVAADMRHPTIGWTIGQLLAHLDARPNYVALAGPIGVGKSRLAASLAANPSDEVWRLVREPVLDERLAAYYGNPRREAWETEREILRRRNDLLHAGAWPADDVWSVSDFWFDQSLAFARRWLDDARFAEFAAEWDAAAAKVVRPKFVVWLDAPPEVLLERISQRGREYEQKLDAATIREIGDAVAERLARDYRGPVLRLDATSDKGLAHEVRAAAAAMA
ncbi:MAG: 2-amino-4-hydroxy-6-hydroxymethyldihydropteridine diphosphokinase [Pirellulales bacterium]